MYRKPKTGSLALSLLLLFALPAWAAPESFVYSGRIIKPDQTYLEDPNVSFTVQLFSPGAEDCLLYEEMHTLNMSGTKGLYTIPVGRGTRAGAQYEDTSTLAEVFNNIGPSVSGLSCAVTNTYTPAPGDSRRLRITFNDGSGNIAMEPTTIRSVPYAQYASSLGGFGADDLIQVDGPSNLTQTNVETVFSNFTELQALLNGTSLQYAVRSSNGASQLPSFASASPPTAPAAGDVWFDSDTGFINYHDGSGIQTVGTAASTGTVTDITVGSGLVDGAGSSGTTITTSGTIALPTVVAGGTYTKVTVDAYGRVTGDSALAESDIPTLSTAGKVSGGAINSGTIGGSTAISTSGNITTSGNVTGAAFSGRSYVLWDSDDTNSITINPPATASLTSDYILTLPTGVGSLGEVLTTDGAGNLSWSDVSQPLVGDIQSGAGEYFSYMPNNVECNDGEILKWQAASDRWTCDTDTNTDAVDSVFGRAGAVIAVSGDYTASQITNVPAGGVAATTVQAAIDELDTDKQNADADLTGLAGLSTNGLVERTGAGTFTTNTVTAAGKALLDDASASAQRTTLGLGTIATQDANSVAITGGAIDGTAIGGTTPASGDFTTLDSSGNASVGGTFGVTGNTTLGGSFTVAGDTSFSGNVDVAATKTVGIGTFTNAEQATLVGGLVAGDEGQFWYNSDTDTLMYWNGSGATALGVSGAGMQSLSGDTTGAQTLSISNGAAVLAPAWNHDGSGDHELRLPLASSAGVTHGLISKTDYDNFNSKQSSTLTDGQILIGNSSNVATGRTPSGDLSMTNTGVFTLATSGVTGGTYKSVTVDAKGRVTAGTNPTSLSGYGITDAIENAGGLPSIEAGADASKGAASIAGRLYVATDTHKVYRDTGATWELVATTDASDISSGTLSSARLPASGVGAGTYKSVTVDTTGRVTSATNPTTISGFGITDAVTNAGNTPSIQAGLDASKPGFGTAGRVYISTDTQEIYRDSGAAWVLISSASGAGGTVTSVTANAPLSITGTAADPVVNLSGTVPLANGGTGATTASGARTNLGLGTIATQDANSVAITGGAIDGTVIGGTTPASGDFTTLDSSGNASVGGTFTVAGDTSFSGNVDVAATKTVGIGTFTNAEQATLVGGLVAGDEGQFWYNSDTNTLMYWNGSSAAALGVSGAGMQSLSGDTTGAQTLSISNGAAVLAPAWNHDGSGDHELRLPLASSAGVTHGLISKTDYDNFNSKQSSTLTDGQILIGNSSNVAIGRSPSGDLSMTNLGVFTLANSGVTGGTYKSVTVDAKGRVTAGTNPTSLSGYGITDAIENAGGLPSIEAGADASKGTADTAGRLYVATDTHKVYRDTGATWELVATTDASDISSGTLSSTRLPASGVGAGTYKSVTVDTTGRVTSATNPTTISGFGITDAVTNAGDTPSIQAGLDASKPAFGTAGRLYISTDTQEIYRDSGAAWVLMASVAAVGGSVDSVGATAPLSNTGTAADPVIALSGTVPLANGGTGATTASGARTNLGLGTAAVEDVGGAIGELPQVTTAFTTDALLHWNNTAGGLEPFVCSVGEYLQYGGAGWGCVDSATDTAAFHNDGDSFGAAATLGTNDPYALIFETNGSERARIDSTGNVGIGTTAPGDLFHVYKASGSLDATFEAVSSSGAVDVETIVNGRKAGIRFHGNTHGTLPNVMHVGPMSGTAGAGQLGFMTGDGTEQIRIDSTGNMGIGTTSPGAKLEVAGQVKITGGVPGAGKVLTSDAAGLATWETPSAGGSGDFMADGSVPMTGALTISMNGDSSMIILDDTNGGSSDNVSIANNGVNFAIDHVESPKNLFNMTLSTGNVNIGTNSASNARLTVHTIDSNDSDLMFTNSTTGELASDGLLIGIDENEVAHITNKENTDLTISTDNSERLRITASGNVGVGTTNPLQKFNVADYDTSVTARVENYASTAARYPGYDVINYTGGFSGSPRFAGLSYRGSSSAPAPVESGDLLLTLEGRGGRDNAWNTYTSGQITIAATQTYSASASGSEMSFLTTANDTTTPQVRLKLSENGNVGVGTSSPAAKLDVDGEVKFGNTSSTCDGTTEGQQRYNSTTKTMQFCNGSSWSSFGSTLLGTMTMAGTTDCYWSTTSSSWTSFSADTDCNAVTTTGNATSPGKYPGITFASLTPGTYRLKFKGYFGPTDNSGGAWGSAGSACAFSLSDGTTNGPALRLDGANGQDTAYALEAVFQYASAQSNVTFTVQTRRDKSTGACVVSAATNNGSHTWRMGDLFMSLERVGD